MNVYKEILIEALSRGKMKITFDNLKVESSNEIVETVCIRLVQRTVKILRNGELDDFECIERITRLFEGAGLDVGNRHDFG